MMGIVWGVREKVKTVRKFNGGISACQPSQVSTDEPGVRSRHYNQT